MHKFEIAKDQYGWVVRLGAGVSAPFRTRILANRAAQDLCLTLRRHGELACVVEAADDSTLSETPSWCAQRRPGGVERSAG
jgi:hypothetical protein